MDQVEYEEFVTREQQIWDELWADTQDDQQPLFSDCIVDELERRRQQRRRLIQLRQQKREAAMIARRKRFAIQKRRVDWMISRLKALRKEKSIAYSPTSPEPLRPILKPTLQITVTAGIRHSQIVYR